MGQDREDRKGRSVIFDVERHVAEEYEAEVRGDLRFEMQLAVRCAVSVILVVLLVIVRQLWLV